MQRIFLMAVMCLTLIAVGCEKSQTIKDSWKFTTRQYRAYLNTPASVDLEDKGSCEIYELALGEAVLAMDMELQKLIRAMENSDHNPDQRWVMSMMHRFPWLSGVALADGTGAVVAQYPEYFAKQFDITPLLEPDPKQRPGALRGYAQLDESGGEVYLANPVFGGEEMRGLIVAHFDVRSLATMSADPGGFVIASPAGVVWPGNFGPQGGAVGNVDWGDLLKKKSCGLIGSEGSGFFWTTRYLGNLPLVYAMPVTSAPASEQAKTAPGQEPALDAPVMDVPVQPTMDAPVMDAPVQPAMDAPAMDAPSDTAASAVGVKNTVCPLLARA